MKAIELPGSLTTIERSAFEASGLENVVLPPSLTKIGGCAFAYCTSLRHVKVAEGLEELCGYYEAAKPDRLCSIFDKSALESVELPSTLKRLGDYTFSGCKNLRNVMLPDGFESIGECCFLENGLRSITLPSSVRRVGAGAFSCCLGL